MDHLLHIYALNLQWDTKITRMEIDQEEGQQEINEILGKYTKEQSLENPHKGIV